MLVFPQLLTGANAQYPLVRTDAFRTALNAMADGREVKFADVGSVSTRWELRLTCLTDGEWAAIANLHQAVEGRLRTFTLLDPLSNLFKWSEDFDKPEWLKDPMLSVAASIADPFGGEAAFRVTNAGQAAQALRQSIAGPGDFQYCCSVWARSVGSGSLTLRLGAESKAIRLDASWKRISFAAFMAGSGEVFSGGFSLDAGSSVDLFGPQLEAQPSAGAYWKTNERSGVYSRVRFESDALELTATDRDRNSGQIALLSVE